MGFFRWLRGGSAGTDLIRHPYKPAILLETC